ncbi:MAG: hypothetical protein QF440_03820, partial [Candidatus Thalassarchaeaceae archaeon]|nr:hypothetical protein [Candidatus Thalassarchaeaceae archaeon]
HPEDSISRLPSEIEHNVPTITCPPITLLNSEEMMNREVARRRLKLPLDVIVAYVQIGAGEINDINSEVRLTIDALTNHEDVHVVLGESMLGERFDFDLPRVHLLRDYPNSMYFPAFDISIQAGGYNSFHEMRNFGMPTLFYPNLFTGMDDQLARCNAAVEEGWGAVLKERNSDTINLAISELLEEAGKRNPRGVENGSISLASEILSR